MYFKFVVSDSTDVNDVDRAVKEYNTKDIDVPVYLMPLGGRSEEYNLTVNDVAELCMEKGWRFTIQDFTYPSSEMPGVLDDGTASRYTNEHLEDVMKKDIDHNDLEKRIREARY